MDKNKFLLKANLYNTVIMYESSELKYKEEFVVTLGGHINTVPDKFNEPFWNSRLDSHVFYWDADEEISKLREGDYLFDDCRIVSINKKPIYEKEWLKYE